MLWSKLSKIVRNTIESIVRNRFYSCKKSNLKRPLCRSERTLKLPVFPEHSSRTDVPFQAPRKQPLLKKMTNYGYGWYSQEQLEDYYDQLIGNFFNILSSIFRIICCFVVNLLSQETTPILWSRRPSQMPGRPTTWRPSSTSPTSSGTVRSSCPP